MARAEHVIRSTSRQFLGSIDMQQRFQASLAPKCDVRFSPEDITAIYCIRAHAENPWIIDRIRLVAEHYDPQPRVLICDLGSLPEFARIVSSACRDAGFEYHFVGDQDVYSPAIARNRAFERVQTDLVFFCDADTIGCSSLFGDLARLASDLDMATCVDLTLVLPVVHLCESDSAQCAVASYGAGLSANLNRLALSYLYREASQRDDAFVVPYSNIYLMRRDHFDLTGGYDERFRGHGSEDFEFLTRLAISSKHLPLPQDWRTDRYGVLRSEFFDHKEYVGFRRLIEAMAYPAEMMGLRVYHLWHPRKNDDWRSQNDWKRVRLKEAFEVYSGNQSKLLTIDFLSRTRRALCVCLHEDHWGYFVPLRLAGYRLSLLYDAEDETIASAAKMIRSGAADAFCIFKPYMQGYSKLKPLFQLARDCGVQTVVVEQGALPRTIYYADDVACVSSEFGQAAFASADYTSAETLLASQYVARLRSGSETIEEQNTYDATADRYSEKLPRTGPVCFIPTQLEEDMAVTRFVTGEQSYADFVGSLVSVIDANPHIQFIVQPHPLSTLSDRENRPNMIGADRRDNVHFLIDAADVVICYNSCVGLLALLHGKPTVTIGNAFYNYDGAGHCTSSLASAVALIGCVAPPSTEMIMRLAAWFHLRKYSTFVATDETREFEQRRAHAYGDVLVTHFRWSGMDICLQRQKVATPLSKRSYLWARIGMSPPPSQAGHPVPSWGIKRRSIHRLAVVALSRSLSPSDRLRLKSNPIDFFQNAKWSPNRFFGRLLLDKSQRPY